MRANIDRGGRLIVTAETGLEAYALRKWIDDGEPHGVLRIVYSSGQGISRTSSQAVGNISQYPAAVEQPEEEV